MNSKNVGSSSCDDIEEIYEKLMIQYNIEEKEEKLSRQGDQKKCEIDSINPTSFLKSTTTNHYNIVTTTTTKTTTAAASTNINDNGNVAIDEHLFRENMGVFECKPIRYRNSSARRNVTSKY